MTKVEPTVNQLLRNDVIKHSHYLESYKTNTVNEILSVMNKMDSELKEKLSSYKTINTFTKKRVQIMQKNVTDIINEANEVLKNKTYKSVSDLATYESGYIVDKIQDTIPNEVNESLLKTGITFVQPSPTQLLASVKSSYFENTTITELMDDWSNRKKKKFNGAIQQGYLQGKGIGEIVNSLFGTKKNKYQDGLAYGSRKQLATSIRTSLAHTAHVSRELTYKENQSVIKGKQWVSTLDGRTSEICMTLDGKIDLFDGSKKELNGQVPPAHFNCRSTTVPVLKSLKELGLGNKDFSPSTRASMNGQVSEKETYSTWFKKQSKSFQKETLGATKYDLYNSGKYTLSSFVSNGVPLSIAQLKATESVSKNIVRNYDSVMATTIGKENYDNIHDLIDESDDKDVAKLWEKYEDKVKYSSIKVANQRAYYSPWDEAITINIKMDKAGDSLHIPYQVNFHETGHLIDRELLKEFGGKTTYYSSAFEDGILPNTIIREVNEHIARIKKEVKADILAHKEDYVYLYKKDYLSPKNYFAWKQRNIKPRTPSVSMKNVQGYFNRSFSGYSLNEMANISDWLEGATLGKLHCGAGHGATYWKSGVNKAGVNTQLGTEVFAEMIDSTLSGNKKQLDLIKEYFPESYSIFKRLVKEVLK